MPATPVDLVPRQPLTGLAVLVFTLLTVLAAGVVLGSPAEAAPPCHVPNTHVG